MRIFNNFDTELKDKEYDYAMQKHGNKNIILIQRTLAYWIVNGIIPFLIFTTIVILFFVMHMKFIQQNGLLSYVLIGVLVLLALSILRYLVNIYLEYKFDFTIISREGISTFKQLGFFNSKNKDLPSSKIRSISSARHGLFGNIFGYGNIEIITDGALSTKDEEGLHLGGKMIMTYVKYPNILRKDIIEICLAENNNNK
ncbi:MAG: hypothetical protein QM490_02745 [Candidatus Gracilibacteria bacterium]